MPAPRRFRSQPLLLPLALATSVVGVLGALAAHTLPRLVAWLTVASVGTILAALGLFGAAAWSAALYYMANSTLVIAGLFLLAELVAAQRGDVGGRLEPASPVAQPALLGLMLLLAAASSAGLPPLPGFIGKLMLLQAAQRARRGGGGLGGGAAVGFLTLLGLARAGSILFWNVRRDLPARRPAPARADAGDRSRCWRLSVAMSVFAAPLQRYTDAAAAQLLRPQRLCRGRAGRAGRLQTPDHAALPHRPGGPR